MNLKEIQSAIKHIMRTCSCPQCKVKYNLENIHIIATTKLEALFEIRCAKCKSLSIVNIYFDPKPEVQKEKIRISRQHNAISENDILDTKNFLETFDGNFKKIFNEHK
ncbi:MAG: hypothetical protein ABIH78_03595 [Candidatus Peregrinibacteria bacterium]